MKKGQSGELVSIGLQNGFRLQAHCCSSGCPVLYVDTFFHSLSAWATVAFHPVLWLPPRRLVFACNTILCVSLPYTILVFHQSLHQGSACLPDVCHTAVLTGYLIHHSLLLLWWNELLTCTRLFCKVVAALKTGTWDYRFPQSSY